MRRWKTLICISIQDSNDIMKPHPFTDYRFSWIPPHRSVKVGIPSPAEDVRERLDLVKLLVRHTASTFYFKVDGMSMIDADSSAALLIADSRDYPFRHHRAFGVGQIKDEPLEPFICLWLRLFLGGSKEKTNYLLDSRKIRKSDFSFWWKSFTFVMLRKRRT